MSGAAQRGDIARQAAFDNRADVLGPALQGYAHWLGISGSVVGTRDTCLVTDMIKHGFDNVRLNTDFSHAGRGTSAEIVQGPRWH